jgi:hypothetical protein
LERRIALNLPHFCQYIPFLKAIDIHAQTNSQIFNATGIIPLFSGNGIMIVAPE